MGRSRGGCDRWRRRRCTWWPGRPLGTLADDLGEPPGVAQGSKARRLSDVQLVHFDLRPDHPGHRWIYDARGRQIDAGGVPSHCPRGLGWPPAIRQGGRPSVQSDRFVYLAVVWIIACRDHGVCELSGPDVRRWRTRASWRRYPVNNARNRGAEKVTKCWLPNSRQVFMPAMPGKAQRNR